MVDRKSNIGLIQRVGRHLWKTSSNLWSVVFLSAQKRANAKALWRLVQPCFCFKRGSEECPVAHVVIESDSTAASCVSYRSLGSSCHVRRTNEGDSCESNGTSHGKLWFRWLRDSDRCEPMLFSIGGLVMRSSSTMSTISFLTQCTIDFYTTWEASTFSCMTFIHGGVGRSAMEKVMGARGLQCIRQSRCSGVSSQDGRSWTWLVHRCKWQYRSLCAKSNAQPRIKVPICCESVRIIGARSDKIANFTIAEMAMTPNCHNPFFQHVHGHQSLQFLFSHHTSSQLLLSSHPNVNTRDRERTWVRRMVRRADGELRRLWKKVSDETCVQMCASDR